MIKEKNSTMKNQNKDIRTIDGVKTKRIIEKNLNKEVIPENIVKKKN